MKDVRKDGNDKTVEEKICKETNADRRDDEEGVGAPAEAPRWGGG